MLNEIIILRQYATDVLGDAHHTIRRLTSWVYQWRDGGLCLEIWHYDSGNYEIFLATRQPASMDSMGVILRRIKHWTAPMGIDQPTRQMEGMGVLMHACDFIKSKGVHL